MKTPITYYRGKQTMLKYILPLIPKHTLYTEAFCGGTAVFFPKEPTPAEVINDINMELVNFYQTLQGNYDTLKARIDQTLHSRDVHRHATYILSAPNFFDDIERAWAIWGLSKMSFVSMLDGTFGYDFKGGIPKKVRNAKDDFSQHLASRLENATIESRHAFEVIKTYDSPTTFHFVDPPYVGSHCGHYEGCFGENDLGHFLDLREQVKGKFMLTMFPHFIIAEYAMNNAWVTHRIERFISASKSSRRKHEEWIVCNYRIEDEEQSLFAES